MLAHSENILSSIYKKATMWMELWILCTLLDCMARLWQETEQADQIVQQIVKEFLAVAEVEQVTLGSASSASTNPLVL